MFDTFQIHSEGEGDLSTMRMRCVCGSEYALSQSRACPACGRRVPKSVSVHGGIWKSYAETKIEALRKMLDSSQMEKFPNDQRATARHGIEKQIRQLEDGTWKIEARRRIERFREMLDVDFNGFNTPQLANLSEKDRHEMRKMFEMGIQTARQELEAAGESP